ncbi:MAG: serine/threonine protein kinase [Myxococcales bacterium]|nr:serine/threonine protein kinase [Myxococcales bacterium]
MGIGGMAEVFRAKALGVEGFEKIVALKRIRPNLVEDEQFVQMFVDEAKIAGQLRHENVVRIFELGMLQGTHFIAMEYVFGKDLLALLATLRRRDQVMAPVMAAWIGAKVLAGLHYAHTRCDANGQPLALIHRDISPQNILLSYDGAVKLIDFGIAKATTRVHQTMGDVVKGKAGYMSPQQIMGEPIDHRSDVFAVSTCLHEMLTCRRLFRAGSDIEVLDRVRNARAEAPSTINPSVPPILESIVMRGLQRLPEDRWQTAGQMHDALMRWIATVEPPFGAPQLASVMQTVFATEMRAEQEHLARLAAVHEPGVRVAASDAIEDEFEAQDTVISERPDDGFESGELSKLVSVDEVLRASQVPAFEDEEPSEPFLLVSRPPSPAAAAPADHLPGSTQSFIVPEGTFDLSDTSEDFQRPFHGALRIDDDGHTSPQILAPGESIPDIPVVVPPTAPTALMAPARLPPPAPPAKSGPPWLLLGLTAVVALLIGAAGVLIALFATGVLPPH